MTARELYAKETGKGPHRYETEDGLPLGGESREYIAWLEERAVAPCETCGWHPGIDDEVSMIQARANAEAAIDATRKEQA